MSLTHTMQFLSNSTLTCNSMLPATAVLLLRKSHLFLLSHSVHYGEID